MSDTELNWRYAEEFVTESAEILQARQHSVELGIEAVSAAVGSQISTLVP